MLPYHNRRIFRSPIQRSEENKKWNVSILHKTSKIKNFIYLLLRILADDLGKGFNIRGDLADFDVLPRDKTEVVDCPVILSETNNLIISHEVLKLFFTCLISPECFEPGKHTFLLKQNLGPLGLLCADVPVKVYLNITMKYSSIQIINAYLFSQADAQVLEFLTVVCLFLTIHETTWYLKLVVEMPFLNIN